jgi:hypothetical protein
VHDSGSADGAEFTRKRGRPPGNSPHSSSRFASCCWGRSSSLGRSRD